MLNRPFCLVSLQPKCGGSAAVPVSAARAGGVGGWWGSSCLPTPKVMDPWCPLPREGDVGDGGSEGAALGAWGRGAEGLRGSVPGDVEFSAWGYNSVLGDADRRDVGRLNS